MSLTYLQYRAVILVGLGVASGVFTTVKFLSNLVLHVKHGQTMPAALGLAAIGTIVYALVVAAIAAAIGAALLKFIRSVLTPDIEREQQ